MPEGPDAGPDTGPDQDGEDQGGGDGEDDGGSVSISSTVVGSNGAWQLQGTIPRNTGVLLNGSGTLNWGGGTSSVGGNVGADDSGTPIYLIPSGYGTVNQYGLVFMVIPRGATAPLTPAQGGTQNTVNILVPKQYPAVYTISELDAAAGTASDKDLYAAINDNIFSDNSGSFTATTTFVYPVAPAELVATYTAGIGVTLTMTAPTTYVGDGFKVYRLPVVEANNGIVKRIDGAQPFAEIPWSTGTITFIDRQMGYPPIRANGNQFVYFVTTVSGGTESPLSTASNAVAFLG